MAKTLYFTTKEVGYKEQGEEKPKTSILNMPKELFKDGFKGDVDVFSTSITFTIVYPSTDLQKVKGILVIILKYIELRLRNKNSNITDTDNKGWNKQDKQKGSSH